MKRVWLTLVAVGLMFGSWHVAVAQEASGGAPQIALVDISLIFKSHPGFKQKLEALRQELSAMESQANQDRQSVGKQREKLSTFNVGSPEYKQLEQEIAHRISDFQVRDQLKKKEIMEREAKAYFETYNEVVGQIQKLADQYRINLVMRYDSDKIDPNDRNSVLAGINRSIVFQRKLDLTQQVITAIGGSTGGTAATGATGAAATADARRAAPAASAAGQPAARQAAAPKTNLPASNSKLR